MSVGKESIKRAASAGAKKTAAAKTAEADVKKTTEAKAATVKAAETKVSSAEKTAGTAKKTTTRKTTAAKTAKSVKTSVLTPANSEEIQAKFISDKAKQPESVNGPVHVTEELPIYLL